MEWDIAENGQRGLIIDGIWYCEELVVPAIAILVEDKQRLRRALDLLGVPAQATKDPDKAPPLRIDVRLAREVMEVVNG